MDSTDTFVSFMATLSGMHSFFSRQVRALDQIIFTFTEHPMEQGKEAWADQAH
jgi:hypothetical protein